MIQIKLEKYNPAWPAQFEEYKNQLKQALNKFSNVQIEHIGSTSVEGLKAKPIIDILIGLSKEQLSNCVVPISRVDYSYIAYYTPELPIRRFFILSRNSKHWNQSLLHPPFPQHAERLAHLHVCTYQSNWWHRHIAFRDLLRSNEQVRSDYEALKEKLSEQSWESGNDYAAAKTSFIENCSR
jgi:GrpB-like predicted nucleotidyltransferase (UPF0157 family)